MKQIFLILIFCCPIILFAQDQKPSYCNDFPDEYSTARGINTPKRGSLPRFGTEPVTEYKIQVAILRNTNPADYPFHKSLIARYRPCEEVWVVESRETFTSRKDADRLKKDLIALGYKGAYITELVGFY